MLHTHTGIPFIGEQKILDSDLPSGHTTVNNFSFTAYLGLISRNEFAMGSEQSHYREVPRWEIFMEQELRFGLDLGRLAVLKKKGLGRL